MTSSVLSIESLLAHTEAIGVVGLGYVGLPLAVHLAQHFKVVGFDIKPARIAELQQGCDHTREVAPSQLVQPALSFSADPAVLQACRLIIVAVPTPIDEYRIPDLEPLRRASQTVGEQLQPQSCVVFESTVYPGATEEVCIPIMEAASGLRFGVDFSVGYSPERINPGDHQHTLATIVKVVSASDDTALTLLQAVYGRIVTAGLYIAPSIKVAEAAKVIENTQRDLNIALMNELAMIFDKMAIDTSEVLAAAGTKWNFLKFTPGLVGGHCIGVDPYYLTFKAESLGYHPEMILAGRRINDNMGKFVAERTVKLLIRAGRRIAGAQVAILGLTFKENVPDLRNTRVVDIIRELAEYEVRTWVHDPLADAAEAQAYYGVTLRPLDTMNDMDAVIVAVMHNEYRQLGLPAICRMCRQRPAIVVDLKYLFDPAGMAVEDLMYWRL